MRTRVMMTAMLGAALALQEPLRGPLAAPPEPSKPKRLSPTREHIWDTGKPPTNGAREVARRLKQMQRKADKDARRAP
jgi:hypothetical protein